MFKKKYNKYKIKNGDSLMQIHKTVGAPIPLLEFISELRKANHWESIPRLYVGQVIKIPKKICSDSFNLREKWLL